jgi:hypothetical protein
VLGGEEPVNLDQSELSAITRMFSSAVFREFGRRGRSPLFARLVAQSPLLADTGSSTTVREVFDYAFGLLRTSGYRDEYVYRSAITQKIVLGRHSLRTATVLNEARAGLCKADVVVLNGTSTAYEIKSERDSLARLRTQLDNYKRVFASVNVVTSPRYLRDVIALAPRDVGVLTLSHRFTIQTERQAQNCPARTSPLMILETLRAEEAVTILQSFGIELPKVPNTQLRGVLRQRFTPLDPTTVHDQMVATLKRTRSQAAIDDFVRAMPESLKTAALAARLDRTAHNRIKQAIATPLGVASTWS